MFDLLLFCNCSLDFKNTMCFHHMSFLKLSRITPYKNKAIVIKQHGKNSCLKFRNVYRIYSFLLDLDLHVRGQGISFFENDDVIMIVVAWSNTIKFVICVTFKMYWTLRYISSFQINKRCLSKIAIWNLPFFCALKLFVFLEFSHLYKTCTYKIYFWKI